MFSTATTTALLFVVFLVILAVTIWIDGKKTYILPPKLNHNDGDDECSEQDASAEHKANTKTGDMLAKVSATGSGKASSWAALGYEYENTESEDKRIIVELTFKYRINLETDNSQSPIRAKITTVVNSDSKSITQQTLTAPATDENKNSGEFTNSTKRHATLLKAGENFTAYLKIEVEGEAGDGGKCSGEIAANLSEIYYRPELKPM